MSREDLDCLNKKDQKTMNQCFVTFFSLKKLVSYVAWHSKLLLLLLLLLLFLLFSILRLKRKTSEQ